MRVHQHLQTVAIGCDKAAEAPLLAEHFIEEPMINVRRYTIDLVVGSHHAAHMAFLDSRLKWNQKILANNAFRIVSRGSIGPAFGLSVHREVLHSRNHMMAVDIECISLQPPYACDRHARNQIRILTISFFRASPATIACQIQHWSEN